jgi:hypothetical protein
MDKELQQFRDLLPPPDRFEEGFGLKAMIGGLFVGMIMTPASMYMQLVTGATIGGAAQWVTVILFLEVARRSFTVLGRAEIYILYYMAGATLISGSGLLWNQFLVQSESMRQFGLAEKIPDWVAPGSPDVLGQRSFFHPAWYIPIGLMALGQVLQRLDNFGLAYVMYRLTSDVEKLPFPLAPVGAQGIIALADARAGRESTRWRVFSFGAMLGMTWAVPYIALPAITGALLGQPITVFPIPFYDATTHTEDFLPAVPMILAIDLGLILSGMVLPFWAVVGSFIGLLVTLIANPILAHTGVLDQWSPGIGAIRTIQSNTLDFYFSFGLGLLAAIAVIGFMQVGRGLMAAKGASAMDWRALLTPPPGRGDFSVWLAISLYVVSTLITIAVAWWLLTDAAAKGLGSPITTTLLAVFVFYGFVYTPLISYVSARMEGVVGQTVGIPFVREATFMLSGYQGAAIWFAPFPLHNYGAQTLLFRQTELTGTSFRSLIKAELFILPIAIVSTVLFSHFIWQIAPVPSAAFPAAEKFWELNAFQSAVIMSSTMPGGENGPFAEAFDWTILLLGFGIAMTMFGALSWFGLPILLVYGIIRGLDQSLPLVILPQFVGALLGRYYFKKRFGGDQWLSNIVVFFAGFNAGFGLVTMLAMGVVFMSKAVIQSAY